MNIEKVLVESLVFDPSNARKHDPKNIEAIKSSLAKFGQQKPIVVDKDNVVIAGNGTLEAVRSLGWTEIEINRTELSGPEAIAFAIADNRSSELAEWENETLAAHLQGLREDDWDLEGLGFDTTDLEELNFDDTPPGEGNIDDDEIPEVTESVAKRGQIWQLGDHRLMCGDSTEKVDVDRLMDGAKADMVFTDPPYKLTGGGTNQIWNKDGTGLGADQYVDNCRGKLFEVPEFSAWVPRLRNSLVDDSIIFVMSNVRNLKPIMQELEAADAKIHNILIMDKNSGFPHIWYTCHSEFILYYYYGKAIHPVNKCKPNIFHVEMPRGEDKKHTSQKPVSMISQIIQDHKINDVYDPFLGSGSTLIACEKTNRKCYGLELDESYCDVIIKRWEEFTGKKAVLLGKT